MPVIQLLDIYFLYVTVIKSLSPTFLAPTWGVISGAVKKKSIDPLVFTSFPQMGIYTQLVQHLLAFLFGGRHAGEWILCSWGREDRDWNSWERGAPSFPAVEQKGWNEISWMEPKDEDSYFLLTCDSLRSSFRPKSE